MSFDLQRVLEGKRAFRQKLAAYPIAEKLRLLDELRARALTIRRATAPISRRSGTVQEDAPDHRTEDHK